MLLLPRKVTVSQVTDVVTPNKKALKLPLSKQDKMLPTVTICIGFFLLLQQMTINLVA